MADLTAPSAGLKPPGVRLRNKSHDVAKVALTIPAGAELEVPEIVAKAAMSQTGAFAVVEASPPEPLSGEVEEASAEPVVLPARRGRRKAED
jgi:hypothetical protein